MDDPVVYIDYDSISITIDTAEAYFEFYISMQNNKTYGNIYNFLVNQKSLKIKEEKVLKKIKLSGLYLIYSAMETTWNEIICRINIPINSKPVQELIAQLQEFIAPHYPELSLIKGT
jgi:radical SAM superfamily enzyme YgiQ (UPF0313 family)